MKKFVWTAAFAAMIAAGAPAWSQSAGGNLKASDPSAIQAVILAEGYRAKMTTDDSGDPLIESGTSGIEFKIFFYGCDHNVDCSSVQFYAGFSNPDHASLDDLNKWNLSHRYGRAYLDSNGIAKIEMDVSMEGEGMSRELFLENLRLWDQVVTQFDDAIWD